MRNSVLVKKNRELKRIQRQVENLIKENKKLQQQTILYKESVKENKRLKHALVRKQRQERDTQAKLQQRAHLQKKKQFVARFMSEQIWANKKEIFAQIDFARISMIEGKVRGLQKELDRIARQSPSLFRSNELQLHVFKNKEVAVDNVLSMRKI